MDASAAAALRAALEAARVIWPALEVSDEAFFERARAAGVHPEKIFAADLYLAAACAAGAPGAAEALERRYFSELDGLFGRLGADRSLADEIKQRLRERLLVGINGEAPQIARYSGKGDLSRWLKVVATREALASIKKQKREVSSEDDALEMFAAPGDGAEIDLLKKTYRAEFKTAFQTALASLSPRARTVMRYSLLDGFSIDQIGAVYGVHRATAARWLERAREELLAGTRERLMARIKVGGAELDSIMRLIHSQLDVSVQRILRENPEDPPAEPK